MWTGCHSHSTSKQQILTSYQSINPDFGHRAGAVLDWGMINTNYRYAIENVGLTTSPTTITTATNADGNVEVTYRPLPLSSTHFPYPVLQFLCTCDKLRHRHS